LEVEDTDDFTSEYLG